MKNAQKPETIHLGKLIKEIKKGHYVIPDFQREFDWNPWDVRELIKSIFFDYYIGSLLLWESDKTNVKTLSCEPLFAYNGGLKPEYIVLDGQQRLTALHYIFFKPDVPFKNRKNRIFFFLNIHEFAFGNEDEAFFYQGATKFYNKVSESYELQFDNLVFPFSILGDGLYELEKWFKEFKNHWEHKIETTNEKEWAVDNNETYNQYIERANKYIETGNYLKDYLEELLDNYEISFVSLSRNIEIGKVCEIFTHINQRGLKLDTFDLLNAITRPKDIFLKNMYREASVIIEDASYPGFEIRSYILMVMSILEQNYCSPKYLYYLVPDAVKTIKNKDGKKEEVVLIKNSQEFIDKWDYSVQAIQKTLKALKNQRDFGAISSKYLPYPSIIPALTTIKAYVEKSKIQNKSQIHSKIHKWYWSSIFLNRYSSSVESTSTKDFMDMKKWFNNDDSEPDCVIDIYREYKNLDLIKEVRSGSAIYKAIFNLIILNGARDWETFELPEYEELDDHHIVPKSWGEKMELGDTINSILNKAPIKPDTNRNIINDNLPNIYLKNFFDNNDKDEVYKVLKSHLISSNAVDILLKEPFTKEDYFAFIEERKKTISNEIKSKLLDNEVELPDDLVSINDTIEEVELKIRSTIIEKLHIETIKDIQGKIPSHIYEKVTFRIEKERKKNPALVSEKEDSVNFSFGFFDLQELHQIVTNKILWNEFEVLFGTKDKFTIELNDIANLRNGIRHTREIDDITKMKGEASLMWFKQQLN